MEKAVTTNTKLLYVCNLIATGTIVDAAVLKNFVAEMSDKYMLAIDEACWIYQPAQHGRLCILNKNVIVIKTFPNYLAWPVPYRLCTGSPDTIKLFNNGQPWPNAGASATAVAAASKSLDDTGFFSMVVQKNQAEKNKLYSLYQSMNMPYIESHTNFVYYSVAAYKGEWQKEMEKETCFAAA